MVNDGAVENIKIEILKAVGHGVNKTTPLMLRVQLSWAPLIENLNDLVETGLLDSLKIDGGSITYILTATGERAIGFYEELTAMMN